MIKFEGVHNKNKLFFISFSNDENEVIDVPIDADSAFRIVRYLEKLAPNVKRTVEQEPEESVNVTDEDGS